MITTKVFKSGHSLAIRIPKEFEFVEAEEVEIVKRGNEVVIKHKTTSLKDAFRLLTSMPEDFMSEERV